MGQNGDCIDGCKFLISNRIGFSAPTVACNPIEMPGFISSNGCPQKLSDIIFVDKHYNRSSLLFAVKPLNNSVEIFFLRITQDFLVNCHANVELGSSFQKTRDSFLTVFALDSNCWGVCEFSMCKLKNVEEVSHQVFIKFPLANDNETKETYSVCTISASAWAWKLSGGTTLEKYSNRDLSESSTLVEA